ncbi:AQG_2a_G0012660.mRNA.1.CDS.1 [Saccharomyces cerevisiae]|uniref:Conserved protein n=1 Tax=Saccharomyces cerevisiae (strain YJM789) TaxID=307796 RepID=A6ZYZ2_YEAS7|nr:hypothetical protein H754_YJM320D00607 [Saccharomyces cerevisiae YJM320]AJU63774.1 hypothetical protein H755_YJM326D00621 [Saccharomyces cerevisiae YJM326]AJU64460.1 hypothetical protein H756_YJM428D00592 [Saccharomyces cerevisiae YJM428]AJU65174.1 hypothetical protein H757_YJM450D00626 [Saccharomyces cerevisiae YJM450]AJU68002.1 hypothetical protein H761_YJM470D00622 [Saccharomyces cerevisiae YJM470]AJU68701.1 hypothetical protein H762_YJM541D00607 [Saccharomyces cerevisiae YJM541]AJU6939
MSFENKLPTPLENNDAKGHMVCTLNKTTDARRAAETLSIAFSNSPAFHFICKKILNIPLAEEVPTRTITTDIISPFLDSPYGEISEVNTFDAVAVWSLPPHVPKARSNDAKFNKDFIDDLNARVKQVIPNGINYYYLFCIGKNLNEKGIRGSVRTIFEEYKRRADEENCAIVLEAIAEHAKSVYEYFGFRNYMTFKYGEGEVDSNGNCDPNGEGFTAYLMIYHKDGNKVLKE